MTDSPLALGLQNTNPLQQIPIDPSEYSQFSRVDLSIEPQAARRSLQRMSTDGQRMSTDGQRALNEINRAGSQKGSIGRLPTRINREATDGDQYGAYRECIRNI